MNDAVGIRDGDPTTTPEANILIVVDHCGKSVLPWRYIRERNGLTIDARTNRCLGTARRETKLEGLLIRTIRCRPYQGAIDPHPFIFNGSAVHADRESDVPTSRNGELNRIRCRLQ